MLASMTPPDGPILIAYDGSAAARQAVADAARLLKARQTLVLTVWEAALAYATVATTPDLSMVPTVDPATVLQVDERLRRQADEVSREGADLARSLGLDAEPLAAADAGDVARTILEVARERHAAAIVMGSRGLSGFRARLEGSASKSVLKHAECPVIVVHEAADEK
jgi:nucleotide-binding universal stress UspA family protein